MAAVITHSVSAGGTVDATADVDGAAWDANHVITGVMTPAQGGTGIVNNDASTITISGSFGATFTVTATTSVTFPTTGTLATLAGSEALTNKTYNGNTWTAGTGTLTIAAGKTLTVSNTLTFTGTDASSVAFGAGGTVLYNGGALGTPSSGTLTNCTGLPLSTGITGAGTGVLTALAVNVGSAGAFVTFDGALGTPSSGTLTNATGLPVASGISGLGTGIATALAVNTGSAGAPVLFNGALGTPSSGTLTNATGLPVASGISGLGTGVATALAVNVGSAGAPVVNGGALGTPSGGTLTNATGLPLSGLVAQAAYTFVGNNTGSSAVPAAIDIAALTAKASPATGDFFLISDGAASGAFKKVDATNVAAASGVSSIAGNTGAFTLGTGLTNSVNDIRVSIPNFSASLSANQGTTTGTTNKVLFNTELSDSNGWYDNVTNYRFQPLVAGKYRVSSQVEAIGTTVTQINLDIFKNGSTYARTVTFSTGTAPTGSIDKVVTFNGSTDYVEIHATATGTGTLEFLGGTAPIRSWFEAQYIGP